MSIKSIYTSAPKSVKVGIWVVVGIGLVWSVSKLVKGGNRLSVKHDTKHNRSFYVSYLISNNYAEPRQQDFLMSANEDYIIAWYKAAKNSQVQFPLDGKLYNVKGGRASQI